MVRRPSRIGTDPAAGLDDLLESSRRIRANIEQVIEGKSDAVRLALVVLLAEGHLLIEDVPGVGKTLLAKALARSIDCTVRRIQFTPDLLPSDVTGVSVYNQELREFEFKPGAVFANLVVGDEINRASPKTQSALLEAMEERQVTVDGTTYVLESPFMVIATQNPIEMEGTYPLPEAQRDRFTARVSMGYPSASAELEMLATHGGADPLDDLEPVADALEVRKLIEIVRGIHVSEDVKRYVVDLATATRESPDLRLGGSPRATLQLLRAGRAQAALDGRDYVLPDDIQQLAGPVLAHRLLPTAEAQVARRTPDAVVADLVARVPLPGLNDAAAALTGAQAALSGLTTRGRCLLAAGVALSACALGLGQRDLLRVGIFLAVLPIAAVAVVARTRYRLACSRRLEPSRVEAGRVATVRLRLDNVSRLPSGVLLMEDALPYSLGGRPRFVLDRVEPRGVRDVTYPVRADSRGRYTVGPLSVRLTDPFGLCELTRSFASIDDLIVTPVITTLPAVRLGGDWAGGGDTTARSAVSSGSDDTATREYRHGDDLRKVHWRSTARVGELMVRREEQPFQSRATLLLDGRLNAHRGDGPGSSYEYAVSAVASVAAHLARAGFLLRLVGETGADVGPPNVPLTQGVVLDSLALVQPSRGHSLAPAVDRLRTGIDGVLVAVLGAIDLEDAERLARLRVGAGTCVAIVLDVDSWAPISARPRVDERSADRTAALLSGSGWRVLPVSFGTTLSSVWPLAGTRGVTRGVPA